MSSYTIRGVPVSFPFPPYDVQTAYMEKVIECLAEKKNGLLESPTGTGKTLSLLCSSLAWLTVQKEQQQELVRLKSMTTTATLSEDTLLEAVADVKPIQSMNSSVPKIIYASRTHSQLSQAVQELKRSSYGHIKASVIGSRDQLCINTDVLQEPTNAAKTTMCRAKTKSKTCSYQLRLEKGRRVNRAFTEQPVLDIEDLVRIGTELEVCPFYAAKDLVQGADIVFMPYNYLFDPKIRNKIALDNAIVILDEAHNVEKLCEDSASVQLRSSDVVAAIADVTAAIKHLEDLEKDGGGLDFNDPMKEFSLSDLETLKGMLVNLGEEIDAIEVKSKAEGRTFNGDFIFELLGAAKMTADNQEPICRLVDGVLQFLAVATRGKKGAGLQAISDLLTIVFADRDAQSHERIIRCYRVHVEIEEVDAKSGKKKVGSLSTTAAHVKSKVVSYWCFSAHFAMRQLLERNTRCVILTSGTLAPMGPLISEMGIPVGVQLENPHIVDSSQVLVQVIGQGPDKEPLISNFNNRNNPKYLQSLGRTILSFCPLVPDGLLVFFPSYPIMETCQKAWKESKVWVEIEKFKRIFVEPRSKNAFLTTMTGYYEQIRDPENKGAAFMAVCRGKVSEGLDFANENGRAVIITGLPFPPLKDPRVLLKKRYLEENRNRDNQMLTGDEWYVLEAARAVNQAIGRVIRHRHDYGAILLCDNRFGDPRQQAQLSKWIQGHLKAIDRGNMNFGKHVGDVSRFFRNAGKTGERKDHPCETDEPQCDKQVDSNGDVVLRPEGIESDNAELQSPESRKRQHVDPPTAVPCTLLQLPLDKCELIKMIKESISKKDYKRFLNALKCYSETLSELGELLSEILIVFREPGHKTFLHGMRRFVKDQDKEAFDNYLALNAI